LRHPVASTENRGRGRSNCFSSLSSGSSLELLGMVLRPGGTYDSSPAIYRRVRKVHEGRVPQGRPNTAANGQAEDPPLLNCRFSHEISIVPSGREQILNTSTGDKSPAYFLVVPPGHTTTATALNAEMCNRDRSKFSLFSRR
jgi:hypothetical protein